MPPRLTAHQMFIAGVTLTAIGATLALVTDGWIALIFESADFPPQSPARSPPSCERSP